MTKHKYNLSKSSYDLTKETDAGEDKEDPHSRPTPLPPNPKFIRKIITVLGIIVFVLAVGLIWHFIAEGRDDTSKKVVHNEAVPSTQQKTDEIEPSADTVNTVSKEPYQEKTTNGEYDNNVVQYTTDETDSAVAESAIGIEENNAEPFDAETDDNSTVSEQVSAEEPLATASVSSTGQSVTAGESIGAETISDEQKSNSTVTTSFSNGSKPTPTSYNTTRPIISEAEQVALWEALDNRAKEVILGVYGNGRERMDALDETYDVIQAMVNEYYRTKYGY